MTDAETMREAASILARRAKKPKNFMVRVLVTLMRKMADDWEAADAV